jgi:single-strand DNA-binding protein
MPLPQIQAAGNLTADPELRFTSTGKPVASFTVACNDRRKDPSGNWVDGDTTFLNCEVWDVKAEQLAEQVQKGQRVHVTGKLRQRSYEATDGTKRTVYEVIHADVYVALKRDPKPTTGWQPPATGDFLPTDEAPPF